MRLYSFIVELNIWKKISMNLGLWRPRIILRKQRNISKKSCRSRQKYFGDTCLVHSARPSGMSHRCFTRGICEHAGCPRQPPPCHWQGQARRRASRRAEPSAPRYDPAWRDQWRFPYPTWACSSGAEQFFIRVHTSLPVHTMRGKPGTEGATAPLAPTPQWSIAEPPTHCLGRDQEKKARGWTAIPCSAQHPRYWNLWGGFATDLKTGGSGLEICYTMKSWVMFTNPSATVGPNFSNQMSRLNLTFSI